MPPPIPTPPPAQSFLLMRGSLRLRAREGVLVEQDLYHIISITDSEPSPRRLSYNTDNHIKE